MRPKRKNGVINYEATGDCQSPYTIVITHAADNCVAGLTV